MTLRKKIALSVVVIALCLSSVLLIVSYRFHKNSMYENYEMVATNIAKIAETQLNPDKFQHYLDSKIKDDEYNKSFEILCDIRENGGIEYLYIVKPELEEVFYVMDTDTSEDAIPLGYHEPYYEGAFADNVERLVKGEAIEPIISDEEYGWLMTVMHPLQDSKGNPAGYICVDISMYDVMMELNEFRSQMIFLLLMITLILSGIFIYLASNVLVKPIRNLALSAGKLVQKKEEDSQNETKVFEESVITSKDEIGYLYKSLVQMEFNMNQYIIHLMEVTTEKERIGAELNVATQIQADMLPNIFPAFPDRKEFDIFASMTPAKEVGGDFYDFFMVDEEHLAIIMADVSGKGVPAALFMVIAKTLIKNHVQNKETPAEVLHNVNNQLCENNEVGMFVTAWLGIINVCTGHVDYVNAGHNYPLVLRENGEVEWVKCRPSLVLGGMENIKYRQHELELEPGDTLYLYTDGVTEALNKELELYGDERLEAVMSKPECRAMNPEMLINSMMENVYHFADGAEQADDITMLAVKLSENQENILWEGTAEPERWQEVSALLEEKLENMGADIPIITKIMIATEEIFVNIASYAYKNLNESYIKCVEQEERKMMIRYQSKERRVEIQFEDWGEAYNPLERENPDITLDAEQRQVGGLGIFMVKKIMDEVSYQYIDGKNVFIMEKEI